MFPTVLSIATITNELNGILNLSVIILSFSFNVFFSAVNLLKRWVIFSIIADITTCLKSENDNQVTPYLSHQDRIHDLGFDNSCRALCKRCLFKTLEI